MTHTVVGLFDSATEAQAATKELIQNGFIKENIDVSNRRYADTGSDTTTTSTTTGSTTGSTASDGIGDSIANFFGSLFGDDPATATNYTNAASDAEAVLAVQVDSAERAAEAAAILDRNGAIDVDERSSQHHGQQNFTGNTAATTDTTTRATSTGTTTGTSANLQDTTTDIEERSSIPVIEEELQVGKREVERGGARIRSRVIEKPVEASVRLREEHIVINRRPVNRAVTNADVNNFSEGEIELTERAEVPVVGKQARVVEEVEVGKRVEEHEETVRDTVRRTDVEVDEIDTDINDTNINTRGAGR